VGPGDPIQDGDLLADGVVASDPLKVLMNLEDDMKNTIGAIEQAADRVALLADNINQTLDADQGQVQRIVSKSEQALDTFQSTMTTIDDLLGDPELKTALKRSLRDLPDVFDDVRDTLHQTQDTLTKFDQVRLKAEKNLDNLAGLTEPLGERGDVLINNIDSTISNLDELVQQLVQFSRAINSGEGSLGKLVYDRELYDRLNRSADNIETATRRIRPILEDVRTFTDKIATDPRQLGVKGALDRKPLGIGLK
jgi:phospholipid/cholesterol/gamma-HCH transport system substrate-binding protein